MFRYVRSRLTFANTISMIALMVALGGGAYAVQIAPENSVVSKSVENRTLKNTDIAKDTIRSGRINDGEIASRDIGKGEVRSPDIKDGDVRSRDLRDGDVRAAELGTIIGRSETVGITSGDTGSKNVQCNPGEQVTGGGAQWDTTEENAVLLESTRVENGWTATGWHNAGGGQKQLTVTAYCLTG